MLVISYNIHINCTCRQVISINRINHQLSSKFYYGIVNMHVTFHLLYPYPSWFLCQIRCFSQFSFTHLVSSYARHFEYACETKEEVYIWWRCVTALFYILWLFLLFFAILFCKADPYSNFFLPWLCLLHLFLSEYCVRWEGVHGGRMRISFKQASALQKPPDRPQHCLKCCN